jgi:chromosome segregation ATPase
MSRTFRISELHAVKQEVSDLEAENAESENLRVTAEMKVVDLEEELESSQRRRSAEPLDDTERAEFQRRIEALNQDNERLTQKIGKLEELKGSSEVGSTESFVKTGSNVDSTESFEALAADADRSELLKRIDGLTRENGALLEKLTRHEEKGSSDTGSTESFERIPAAGEGATKLESLARQNYELVAKVTRLEEILATTTATAAAAQVSAPVALAQEPKLEGVALAESEAIPTIAEDIAAFAGKLSADVWESEDLPEEPNKVSKSVAEEQLAAVAALEREIERCETVISEQKVTIEELRVKLVGWEAEVVAGLRSDLESKDEELRAALATIDKLHVELEASDGHERAAKLMRERLEEEERKLADLLADKRVQEEARDHAEKRLLELGARHEENLRHASNVSEELRQAYKSLELLKLKHTEDMDMLNRRLEDVMEELQTRLQENASLESELQEVEKSAALQRNASEEARVNLEIQLQELKDTAQARLDKLQTCATVAKKKAAQCEKLKEQLSEVEEKYSLEKSEKDMREAELRDSLADRQSKDNRIAAMEKELERLAADKNVALHELEAIKAELVLAKAKEKEIDIMKDELQRLESDKNEAFHEVELTREQLIRAREKESTVATDMRMKLQQLQKSKDEVLRELNTSNAKLISMADKDNEIANLKETLMRSEADRDRALMEINVAKMKLGEAKEKDNKIVSLEEELQCLSNERDEILQEMEVLRSKFYAIDEETSKIPDMEEKLQHLQAELDDAQTARDEALLVISVNLDEIKKRDSQILDMNGTLSRYQSGQEYCEKEIEKLKAKLEATLENDKTIADLKEELESLRHARDETERQNEVLRVQVSVIRDANETVQELWEELQRMRISRDEALQELETVKGELSEAKDKARELGIRIEDTNTKCIEQLGQINSLRAENGMLLSKQVRVNERLETLEKERLMEGTRRSEASIDPTCGHCTSRLQALEEILQERDAEIENLDNDLHNSIGDLMQMQEHLRLSSVPATVGHDASAQESYEELAFRFNVLTVQAEETRAKYEQTLGHNEDLLSRITQLQDFNASLQSRLDAIEVDLMERSKKQDRETSPMALGLEQSRSSDVESVVEEDWGLEATTSTIDAETSQPGNHAGESEDREKREAPMPLFQGSTTILSQPRKVPCTEEPSGRSELLTETFEPRVTLGIKEKLERLWESPDELKAELSSMEQQLAELDAVKSENEVLLAEQEVYRRRLAAAEAKLGGDGSARMAELENRVTHVISERDLLQLQVNDVTRAYEEQREASGTEMRSLREELEASSRMRTQLEKELLELRASDDAPPTIEQEVAPESMWEDEEEDPWGLNDKSVSIEQHVLIPVIPSETIRLRVRVEELEENLSQLMEEKAKLADESKNVQLKNIKCVKKLKEYKLQLDSLQQQLKSQRSVGSLGADLDSAIEEELKVQIASLEKALAEAHEEAKKIHAERDNLLKRIDVLTAAAERFTEAKEKQDTELHIWQKRYKDLELRLQQQESGPEATVADVTTEVSATTGSASSYEEELKELRDNVDALATENEELQQLLEEHRTKRQASLDNLQAKNADLTASNDKLASDYSSLRKQYEQSLMDANDQVLSVRQKSDLLKQELEEKSANNERLAAELRASTEARTLLELDAERLSELSSLLVTREQELARLTEELRDYRANEETEAELRAAKDNLKGMELSIEGYTTELQERAEELHVLRDRVSGQEARLLEQEQRFVVLETELQLREERLREREEEARVARETASGYEEEIRVLRETTSGQAEVFAEKERHLAELELQLQALSEDRRNVEQELAYKLEEAGQRVTELGVVIAERDAYLAQVEETRARLEAALHEREGVPETREAEIPVFTFPGGNDDGELQRLRLELAAKNEEIEELQEWTNKNTIIHMVQGMQDNINALYNDKSALEQQLAEKSQEIQAFKVFL